MNHEGHEEHEGAKPITVASSPRTGCGSRHH